MTPISTVRGFLTVTDLNDFNGLAQTTNLGVRSSNLFGRAISLVISTLLFPRYRSRYPKFLDVGSLSAHRRLAILGEAHLRRILKSNADYYNCDRTHRSLNKDAAVSRPVQRTGVTSSRAIPATGDIPSNSAMRRSISLITCFENGPRCMYSAISITM
jgi:hypothetical protein